MDGKWKAFDKLFLLKPQEDDDRRIEKIHSHTMKRKGEESLVDQRFPRGLKEMDRCELAGDIKQRKLQIVPWWRRVVMSRKLATRGSGLRITKLDNHQVSSGAGNRRIVCRLPSQLQM